MAAVLLCGFAPAARAQSQVQVATLQPVTWREEIKLSASIDAMNDATLAAQRSGRITQVSFASGQTVAAGAVLAQLDNAPEQAQLTLDQARLAQAERAAQRTAKLMSIAGSSQAALEQAQADAAEARAQVALDQANLTQLQVIAPFAGTVGIRRVTAGDYVQAGQSITDITQTAPLRVLFSVPQTEAGGLAVGNGFSLSTAAMADDPITAAGRITALSPMVNTATNARDGEGLVTANAAGLLPGMFGTVTLQTGAPKPAFQVPATALNDSVLGRYLFVLQPAGKAFTLHTVYVTELSQSGQTALVGTDGLRSGEKVVAIGGFNLTDGASVTPAAP